METIQTHEKPSFETVWATLQENAQQLKETERILKENADRFDRQQQENAQQLKETERIMEKNAKEQRERSDLLNKQLSKLGNRYGEMVEYLVVPDLVEKFRALGFVSEKCHQRTVIKDKDNNTLTEIDITLKNGDKVMFIEVKSKPTITDINEHIERIEKLRTYYDLRGDRRKFLGGIAGIVFNENEKKYALKCGFYVLEPAGDVFRIIVPKGENTLREW